MKNDSIIFDMDGVLVTNASYIEAIKKTVEFVLRKKFIIRKQVGSKCIEEIKRIPGFNNDWDTAFALIKLLGNGVDAEEFRKQVNRITPKIRETSEYREIKDIFQTFYLGETLFRKIYGRAATFKNKNGLIRKENLLIEINLLKMLAGKYSLGIATSRPKFEALFAVKNLKITPDFIVEKFIVAKEDTVREKPYPDPLLELKKRMSVRRPIYIGDTINDVIAAKKANMPCVFVGRGNLGDFQINHINQIQELLI